MTPTKRRGAGAAGRRPQRLALSSISASDANTPRRRGDADVRAKLARIGVSGTSTTQRADDETTETKLWNMLPGACEYSVADSPHLKLVYPPDGGGVSTPRAAESSSPVSTETTPQPIDLSHIPMMEHHATGFPDATATQSQPVQPADSPHMTADMLTPDARLQRRRKALASGSFKDGAGALFSNTAHLDLELLGVPTTAAPPHSSAGSHPVGGMLGMVGCVFLGILLQPILFMPWPQTAAPLPLVGLPEETALQPAAAPIPSDRHSTPPQWVAPHVDVSEVCPIAVDTKAKPAQVVSHRYDSTALWNPLLLERQVVQAAAHEWSLLEISRLRTRLSEAEQERDLLKQQMAENLGTLKTVVAMEMAEHRARVMLEQDLHWLEAELATLAQSEQESWWHAEQLAQGFLELESEVERRSLPNGYYVCLIKARLKKTPSLDSDVTGTIAPGEVVEVIDSVVTSDGRVRLQINGPWRDNGAWASMIATDGAVLFRAVSSIDSASDAIMLTGNAKLL